MAAKTVNPTAMAENWAAAMGRAGPRYQAGISAVTVNPMALAASPEGMANYLAGVQRSITSGKRVRSLNAADAGYWKSQATQFGPSALAAAGQKKKAKYMAAAQRIAPILNAASQAVQGMPKGGLGNAQARSAAAIAAMMQAAGTA